MAHLAHGYHGEGDADRQKERAAQIIENIQTETREPDTLYIPEDPTSVAWPLEKSSIQNGNVRTHGMKLLGIY